MPVVNFAVTGRENCVVVAGIAYVYATVGGRGFVMSAQCPHRGGPLHLAGVTPDASRLICPWHDRKTSTARLRAGSPPCAPGPGSRPSSPRAGRAPPPMRCDDP